MKLRVSIVTLSALFIAACSGSAANGSDAAEGGGTPAAPVATAAAPKGKSWVDTVRATPEGGFVMGNPNAPLKLIEFGSRLCPFCGEFDRTGLPQLKAKYIATGKVSYGTEGGYYEKAGIPAIVCGPGHIAQAHQPDEWIAESELAACDAFIRRLADRLSG